MALAASQVIDAIAAKLVPLGLSNGHVYTDRAWPVAESDVPYWLVTAESESVESADLGGDLNQHQLEVLCRGKVKAITGIDDAMHALASGGMALLFALPVPYHLQLTRIERSVQVGGESAIGEIAISIIATFFAKQSVPDTILS
jgi:hypothetical protein